MNKPCMEYNMWKARGKNMLVILNPTKFEQITIPVFEKNVYRG